MYYCNNCGFEFDSPKLQMEHISDYWGAPYYEPWGACPNCGDDDIEDMAYCNMCNEYFPPNGMNYCDNCIDIVRGAFQETINKLAEEWLYKKDDITDMLCDLLDEGVL